MKKIAILILAVLAAGIAGAQVVNNARGEASDNEKGLKELKKQALYEAKLDAIRQTQGEEVKSIITRGVSGDLEKTEAYKMSEWSTLMVEGAVEDVRGVEYAYEVVNGELLKVTATIKSCKVKRSGKDPGFRIALSGIKKNQPYIGERRNEKGDKIKDGEKIDIRINTPSNKDCYLRIFWFPPDVRNECTQEWETYGEQVFPDPEHRFFKDEKFLRAEQYSFPMKEQYLQPGAPHDIELVATKVGADEREELTYMVVVALKKAIPFAGKDGENIDPSHCTWGDFYRWWMTIPEDEKTMAIEPIVVR